MDILPGFAVRRRASGWSAEPSPSIRVDIARTIAGSIARDIADDIVGDIDRNRV
jgi:hypothetical protein